MFSFSISAEEYCLTLNLREDDAYEYDINVETEMGYNMMGFEFSFKQVMEIESLMTVLDKQDDNYQLEMEVIDGNTYFTEFNFPDFTEQEQEIDLDEMNQELKEFNENLKDYRFNLTVSATGEIIDSEFDNETIKTTLPDAESQEQMEIFEETIFNDHFLTKSLEHNFLHIPEEPVKLSDNWTKSISMDTIINMDFMNEYTLQEVSDEEIILELKGDIETVLLEDDLLFGTSENEEMDLDFRGTSEGEIILNPQNNWIKEFSEKSSMEGSILIIEPEMNQEFQIPFYTNLNTQITVNEK